MKSYHDIEKVLSWAKYLYASDILYHRYVEELDNPASNEEDPEGWFSFMLMSQWYGSFWVVIEGWKALDLKDEAIEALLNGAEDLYYLLKRYRNGMFHYQPRLLEERFLAFLRESNESVPWLHALHNEFLRFYYDWVDGVEGCKEDKEDFRNSVLSIVGWIPSDTLHVKIKELEKLARHAGELVLLSDNPSEETAKDLLSTSERVRAIARESYLKKEQHKKAYLNYIQCRSKSI